MASKPLVLHLIPSLETGGAEMMLVRLLSQVDRGRFDSAVVTMVPGGELEPAVRALGLPVDSLQMRRGKPGLGALARLVALLRQRRPAVVQSWLYPADLLAGLAGRLAGGVPVVWGVHHTRFEPGADKRLTVLTRAVCARLSRCLTRRVVCCSQASEQIHREVGYAPERLVVIPNGFDLTHFVPRPAAHGEVARLLGVPEASLIVGHLGRFHPVKGHELFLAAAERLCRELDDVQFLLCGNEVTPANSELAAWIAERHLTDRVHLLGRREDVDRLLAGCDLVCSSSSSEAFPLVVGEAMACGVPCVVTDVGDSAFLLGDAGRVVPAGEAGALASALLELLRLPPSERSALGAAGRRRVEARFSLPAVARRYEEVWQEALVARRQRVRGTTPVAASGQERRLDDDLAADPAALGPGPARPAGVAPAALPEAPR